MQTLRSLKTPNFRLYFGGQMVSVMGTFMQITAVSWLAWSLTHSSKWLGAIAFASQIPILIFGLFAGVMADRVSRQTIVITVQTIAMIQAVVLALLTLTGHITAPILFVLTLIMGLVMAFDYPARQVFLMDMVGRSDVGNAVALNSSLVHMARFLGPLFAGYIIMYFGEGTCFGINAATYLLMLVCLFLINKRELVPQIFESGHTVTESIKEVLGYILKTEEAKQPLFLLATFSILLMPYLALMPEIVATHFNGGAGELGVAIGASGLGALIGAIYFASRKDTNGLYNLTRKSFVVSAVVLIAFAHAPTFAIAIPILVIFGVVNFVIVAGTNTILQVTSPENIRGRVISVFTVTFFGFMPIGSLIAGYAASFITVKWTLIIGALICLAKTLYTLIFSKIQSS